MRGGFVHNDVMVEPLADAFEADGWNTELEVPIRTGESIAFIDLVADCDGYCIAVEAECSPARIDRDLDKGQALSADELWIVTPNVRVADSVRRKLGRMLIPVDRGGLFVLTQGAAMARVRDCLSLFAAA